MKQIEVIESANHQHRLTIRKDGITIKVAKSTDKSVRERVVDFFTEVAKKHSDTPCTLRGSTNKVQLGISLFNDARSKCFFHEGSFAL